MVTREEAQLEAERIAVVEYFKQKYPSLISAGISADEKEYIVTVENEDKTHKQMTSPRGQNKEVKSLANKIFEERFGEVEVHRGVRTWRNLQ